jgi:hypothetical protein
VALEADVDTVGLCGNGVHFVPFGLGVCLATMPLPEWALATQAIAINTINGFGDTYR